MHHFVHSKQVLMSLTAHVSDFNERKAKVYRPKYARDSLQTRVATV